METVSEESSARKERLGAQDRGTLIIYPREWRELREVSLPATLGH